MPSWKIHIEIGKRLNKYLKYEGEEYNIFLLGNILPDINDGYVVTNISKKIDKDITHFRTYNEKPHIAFYNKYQVKIEEKNSLFLGCFIHLYVDYIWNNNFYSNLGNEKLKHKTRDELRRLKQSDFRLYNNKFVDNFIEVKDIDSCIKEIKNIEEISLTENDIRLVIQHLKTKKVYEADFQFYTIEDLNKLMFETVERIKAYIDEHDIK